MHTSQAILQDLDCSKEVDRELSDLISLRQPSAPALIFKLTKLCKTW